MLNYLSNITVIPNEKIILSRLGYRTGTTILSAADRQRFDEGVRLAGQLCNNRAVWERLPITIREHNEIQLADKTVLCSEDLTKLLNNSEEVLLMCVTSGNEVCAQIAEDIVSGNAARGMIIDAVASEIADGILDELQALIGKQLKREGKKLTSNRYSPGYGDISMETQKILFDLLQAEKLNLQLTEKFMLLPEKSVIALAGIERV